MTDHESDNQPMDAAAPAADVTDATEADPGIERPPSFLADLARAMQSTAVAEQARDAELTAQRRQGHIDGIRAREAIEADQLRELAKEDVAAIDAWSDGEIRRIKLERERRISDRRDQLQLRLEEHRQVIGREVDAVEAAVGAYREETDQFFSRLGSETDPVEIARQAGTRPGFPILELIGPEDAPVDSSAVDAEVPEAVETPATTDVSETPAESIADAPAAPPVDGPTDDRLIGVMDGGSPTGVPTSSWPPPVVAEPAPIAEPAPTVETAPVASPVGAPERSTEQGSSDTSADGAEVRGVVPRTGAGSWLRWPNSSPDRPDSDR